MPGIFLKTQNRGRKYGKMSDQTRSFIGMILICISVTLCLIIVFSSTQESAASFVSGNKTEWILSSLENTENGTVAVNRANKDELTELPGIGETLAEQIIMERDNNGPYFFPEDLEAVKGIGPATLNKIREMIDLSVDESEDFNGLSGTLP